jgi:arylsulfatase A-like enzyme
MKSILFVADAVRSDHLGCYGRSDIETEAIDRLAEEGVCFEQVISPAPWTAPSLASIISGIYAHRHQILTWDRGFDPSVYTLFHAFADQEHAVGSFVFDQAYLFSQMPFACVQGNSDRFDQVCAWVHEHRQQDFFLLVHSWATHMPYNVPHAERLEWKAAKQTFIHRLQTGGEEAIRESQAAYRQAIEYTSAHQVGRLLDLLTELEISQQTLFILIADHGESWGERFTDKQEIQGIHHLHGRFLYDETLKVPLIMRWPERLPAGRVVSEQVRSVDLAPTLFDLACFSQPSSCSPDGWSLLPLIEGSEEGKDRPALSATSEFGRLSRMSLRRGGHKYIHTLDGQTQELYDLRRDPEERMNLVTEQAALAHEMRTEIKNELAQVQLIDLTSEEEALLIDRLEQLGYL